MSEHPEKGATSEPKDLRSYSPPAYDASATSAGPLAEAPLHPTESDGRTGLRLRRMFWIGAAAILIVAALVAIAAIVRGDFSETDGQILGTLGSLLLCGALAVAGLSLVERSLLPALGWGSVVSATLGFVLLVSTIWSSFESDTLSRSAGTALVAIVVALLVVTSLLLLRGRTLLPLVAGDAFALGIAGLIAVAAIWSDDLSEGAAKADAVFWVLGVLGWLLIPVVRLFSSVGAEQAAVRVLGELDGVDLVASRGPVEGVAVESPVSGERLFLRRRG